MADDPVDESDRSPEGRRRRRLRRIRFESATAGDLSTSDEDSSPRPKSPARILGSFEATGPFRLGLALSLGEDEDQDDGEAPSDMLAFRDPTAGRWGRGGRRQQQQQQEERGTFAERTGSVGGSGGESVSSASDDDGEGPEAALYRYAHQPFKKKYYLSEQPLFGRAHRAYSGGPMFGYARSCSLSSIGFLFVIGIRRALASAQRNYGATHPLTGAAAANLGVGDPMGSHPPHPPPITPPPPPPPLLHAPPATSRLGTPLSSCLAESRLPSTGEAASLAPRQHFGGPSPPPRAPPPTPKPLLRLPGVLSALRRALRRAPRRAGGWPGRPGWPGEVRAAAPRRRWARP